ncbi:hypothetical protein LSCM1_02067 [Leishmania martiniquensis]|uniref:HPP transmembrane region domain-containing protein n=1 Tax=Leishmania martiniquensis TaxID=1580590 RepID=A0A836KJL6_9TRYP|nr:hypothetical protein LSCM1_02067 [Leishmania martiniquensis]
MASSEAVVSPLRPPSAEREDGSDEAVTNTQEPYFMTGNGNLVDGGVTEAMAREVLEEPPEEMQRRHKSLLLVYLCRLKGAGRPGPVLFAPTWDCIPAFLFTAITLIVLAVIEAFGLAPYNLGLLSYLPSFGASCCLVMCLLSSPGAQPRALILSHIVSAFLGVSWSHITSSLPKPLSQQLACSFAVGMITALMMLTGALQPSASATACLAAFHMYGQLKDEGFMYMVTPATIGPCVIVFLGWVFNNLVPWRHCYPVWW